MCACRTWTPRSARRRRWARARTPGRWLAYVRVPSADTAARTAQRSGGRVVSGPMDVPGGGRIAQCVDPQGAVIAVHAVAVAVKPAARPAGKRKAPRAKAKKAAKKA